MRSTGILPGENIDFFSETMQSLGLDFYKDIYYSKVSRSRVYYSCPPYPFQTDSNKKLESREKELSDSKLLIQQHEAHIKTVAESMKQLETKKQGLERQVDELNEECANLKAQGGRPLEITSSIHLIERLNLISSSKVFLKGIVDFFGCFKEQPIVASV